MTLREELESTMHEAMRAKDEITRDTIRWYFLPLNR